MFADQMLDVAVIGNLYHAIIGVDVNQPLASFVLNDLGIDVAQDLLDEGAIRAGTTGLTPDGLQAKLDLLDPVLSVLSQGSLDRDDFTQLYLDSLCILSGPLRNQPDAALCDATAQAALAN